MTPTPNPPVPPQPEPQSELAKANINALQAVVAFLEGAEAAATKDARAFAWSPADEVQKAIEELIALRAENARLTGELAETVIHLKAGYKIHANCEEQNESLRQQLAAVTEHRDQLLKPIAIPAPLKMELELCQNDLLVAKAQLAQSERELSEARMHRRWNIAQIEGSDNLQICRGEHDKNAACKWEVFVPEAELTAQRDTATRAGMAEEDKAMLDWLDGNYFTAYRHADADPDHEKKHPAHCVVVNEALPTRFGNVAQSIREALKSAMNAALPKGRL